MSVRPIPTGYTAVTPYLVCNNAAKVIEFVKQAFGARVHINMEMPGGLIGHAEAEVYGSKIMISDANQNWEPMPSTLYLYVNDADVTYLKAVEAGGESIMEPADQFYGDRHGGVKDPGGNIWWIATHIEDVSEEEIARRAKQCMAKATEA